MEIKVQVLMSTYNGERYLKEQLDSILEQKGVQLELLVRDDGSTDGTGEILKSYAGQYKNITLLFGENVGVIQSFFNLMDAADTSMDYFSFADQDDVWLPDKLLRAVSMLQSENGSRAVTKGQRTTPLAYCSATRLVDEKLNPLPAAIKYPKVRTEFGNALVENMCTGCTCVINKELLMLMQGRRPEFTVMHDFWIYLVGTCFGIVIYDSESRILYRQHGGNELGAASSLLENYRRRIKNRKKHQGQLGKQAGEFLRIYKKEIPQDKKELAEEITLARCNIKIRRKLLKEQRIFRQRKSDDLIFRVLMATGKI